MRRQDPHQPMMILYWERDQPPGGPEEWPTITIHGPGGMLGLDVVQAQGVAAMLAYLAPSPQTVAVARVLQAGAGLAFRDYGLPEHGPMDGAHNPWRARSGDTSEGA